MGVRVLGEGTRALAEQAWPGAEVEYQSYGSGIAPINIAGPRTLLRELVFDSRGGRSWLQSFDVVIDTGAGDSFADIYGLPRLRGRAAMALFVKALHVPYVLGPQTVGPFETAEGRRLGRLMLKTARLALARDSESAYAARELGRPVDHVTSDVVFFLPQPERSVEHDVLLNVSGLLWTSDAHGSAANYRRVVGEVINGLRQRGRTITLLPHVLESRFPDNDMPAITEVAREHDLPVAEVGDLQDVRAHVAGAALVIGSRMHACLNALSVGTPALPLAYSRKFAPLMRDLGWHHVVDLNASPDPASELLGLLNAHGSEMASQAEQLQCAAQSRCEESVAALRTVL
nr:polysaccharide pyruvyl transferase family protein [Propioniciclava soli]